MRVLVVLFFVLFCVGCSTATRYNKKVTVEKDQDGKVIKTTVEEEITQPALKEDVVTLKHINE